MLKTAKKPSKRSKNCQKCRKTLEKSVKIWNNLEKTVKNIEKR